MANPIDSSSSVRSVRSLSCSVSGRAAICTSSSNSTCFPFPLPLLDVEVDAMGWMSPFEYFRERVRVAGGDEIAGEVVEVVGDGRLEPALLVPLLGKTVSYT